MRRSSKWLKMIFRNDFLINKGLEGCAETILHSLLLFQALLWHFIYMMIFIWYFVKVHDIMGTFLKRILK